MNKINWINKCKSRLISILNDKIIRYNYKKNKNLDKKLFFINKIFIGLIITILFPIFSCNELKLRNLYSESKITMKVHKKGNIYILNKNYEYKPSKVFINDIEKEVSNNNNYYLPKSKNNVTLIWNYPIKSCSSMFQGLNYLISIDLNSFDASEVTSMNSMFSNCGQLIIVEAKDIDTTNVKDMSNMFSQCTSLLSLDLTGFDTSSLTNIKNMFYICSSLISLNLDKFMTLNVEDDNNAFYSITKLVYCVNDFKILSNGISSKLTTTSGFENNCNDACFTNIQNKFIREENICIDNCANHNKYIYEYYSVCYKKCPSGTHISSYNPNLCEEDLECDNYYNYNHTECLDEIIEGYYLNESHSKTIYKCENKCKTCNYQSTKNDFCLSCNNNKGYYEIENDNLNIDNMKKCYNIIPEGYYFDITNKIYKKCFLTCKSCDGPGNENNNQCTECDINHILYNKNCYEKCEHYYYLDLTGFHCTINRNCPENYKYLIESENKCIENCNKDKIYKLEYNNKCFQSCPTETYYNYEQTGCLDDIPEGYYLNDSNHRTIDKCHIKCQACTLESINNNNFCISCNNNNGYFKKSDETNFVECYSGELDGYYLDKINNIYKKCYKTCKKCSEEGNAMNHKCSECYSSSTLYDTNCYENCKYYYYFDSSNEYHCTSTDKCPSEYSKLIPGKKKCIDNCDNDDIFKFEYNNICIQLSSTIIKTNIDEKECPDNYYFINKMTNLCIKDCSPVDFFNNICGIRNNNNNGKDILIKNISNELVNGLLDSLTTNLDNNFLENKYFYIKENDISFQIIISNNQTNSHKYNNISTLILGECENILKEIYNIDKNQTLIIFKVDYYKEDSFIPIIGYEIFHPINYTKLDLTYCKNQFVNIYISVSIDEDNLFKFDPNDDYYTDECFPYTTIKGTDILIKDRQEEYNNNKKFLCENNCIFKGYDVNTKISNCECEIKSKQIVIKEIIKQKDILFHNFSDINESSNIVGMKCFYTLFSKEGLSKNISSYILIVIIVIYIILAFLFYKIGYNSLMEEIKIILLKKDEKKDNSSKDISTNINFPKKRRNIKNIKKELLVKQENVNNAKSISKLDIGNSNLVVYPNFKNKKFEIKPTIANLKIYNDYELNSFSYEEALENDKRTYLDYYISLIKTKHPIIFSFFPFKDYNSIIIKIGLFLLSFSIYYFVNCFFFDSTTIHKIYKEEGKFNLSYLIPYAIYSFLISHIIVIIIKYFSLSEKNINEINKENNLEKAKERVIKVKYLLKIKYICFFSLNFVFLLFFWFFLSSFGALYQNTQIYLIKNTLISFGICLFYPFVINLFPGLFRIYSLKEPNRVYIYNIGKVIQMI